MIDDDDEFEEPRPPPEVTRELFLEWRAARRGTANPQRMTNPVWAWLAQQPGVSAYQACDYFDGWNAAGHGWTTGPGWTNHRFGQTRTDLPDGRRIAIAGEHEDSYDEDFFIYNDVIVTAPDGGVEILCYPPEVFPPTDSHSATPVGDHIYVIGSLGYQRDRGDQTQVMRLDVDTFAMSRLETVGDDPGWLWKHIAVLGADGRAITVSGGHREVRQGDGRIDRENIDDYRLALDDLTWTRLTDRSWAQWEIRRERGTVSWRLQEYAALERIGCFDPPVAYRAQDQTAFFVHRIIVDGVTVRYVDKLAVSSCIRLVVEGTLPAATVAALVEDLRGKLEHADDGGTYIVRRLDS